MVSIKLNNETMLHPESWDELSRDEFLLITPILLQEKISEIDRFRITNYLLGIKKDLYMPIPDQLLKLHEFLFSDGQCRKWFVDLVYGIKSWNGFADSLQGVEFGRWIFADSYYQRWLYSKDYDEFLKFMAVVYLPSYKMDDVLKNYKIFRHASAYETKGIELNFKLIKRWVSRQFVHLFPEVGKKEKTSPNFGKQLKPWEVWLDIFDGLVGDDVLNEDEYAALPAMTVFRKLDKKLSKK